MKRKLCILAVGFAVGLASCTTKQNSEQRLANLENRVRGIEDDQKRQSEAQAKRDADILIKLKELEGAVARIPAAPAVPAKKGAKGQPAVQAYQAPAYPSQQTPAYPAPQAQAPAYPAAQAQGNYYPPAVPPAGVNWGPPRTPVPFASVAQPQSASAARPASQPVVPVSQNVGAPAAAAPAQPALASQAAPVQPAAQSSSAGLASPAENAALDAAVKEALNGKTAEARNKLGDFMQRYPSSELMPNALYWMGESYFHDRSYAQAVLSFKDMVTRYPKNAKSAEATYKLGTAYELLGDKGNAQSSYQALLANYPGSPFAAEAKARLGLLGK